MTAKEYLQQYKRLDTTINAKIEQKNGCSHEYNMFRRKADL